MNEEDRMPIPAVPYDDDFDLAIKRYFADASSLYTSQDLRENGYLIMPKTDDLRYLAEQLAAELRVIIIEKQIEEATRPTTKVERKARLGELLHERDNLRAARAYRERRAVVLPHDGEGLATTSQTDDTDRRRNR